jgi:hypothetical protein
MARSLYAAAIDTVNTITVQLYSQGLHNTPRKLRETLQDEIDAIEPNTYDAIILAYGMCGTSTVGLVARHTPLVIPRAHDCITLYLGSREKYEQEFNSHPGTYWYSQDYLERNTSGDDVMLGAGDTTGGDTYEDYVERYGKETADYLMETMNAWRQHYTRAVFIDTGSKGSEAYEQQTIAKAEERGWLFERKEGNARLVQMLVNGDWAEHEFLVVPPGFKIVQSNPDELIHAKKMD